MAKVNFIVSHSDILSYVWLGSFSLFLAYYNNFLVKRKRKKKKSRDRHRIKYRNERQGN